MKKHLIFGLALILALLIILNCSTKEKDNKVTIVAVGNTELTWDMLNAEIPDMLKPSISREQLNTYIQLWIEKELIYQAAIKMGMDLDQDYRIQLEKAKKELLVRKYLDEFLLNIDEEIIEEEAFKYYEKNKETYLVAESEISALHILVTTKAEADEARRRILGGEDFEKVAKEVSLDYADRKRIKLDFFTRKDVVPEVGAKVFSYRVGSITRPIKSEFGYHIFKILDRKEKGTYKDFEEVKDQIIERLKSAKRKQRYRQLITKLRSKMIVKKNENFLNQVYKDTTAIRSQ